MPDLLISVHPLYANLIATGEKIWELRKEAPGLAVDGAWIYSTTARNDRERSVPHRAIVAKAKIGAIVKDSATNIWKGNLELGNPAQISKAYFDAYFKGRKTAVAIVLTEVIKVHIPLEAIRKVVPHFHPPQGHVYLNQDTPLLSLFLEESQVAEREESFDRLKKEINFGVCA